MCRLAKLPKTYRRKTKHRIEIYGNCIRYGARYKKWAKPENPKKYSKCHAGLNEQCRRRRKLIVIVCAFVIFCHKRFLFVGIRPDCGHTVVLSLAPG